MNLRHQFEQGPKHFKTWWLIFSDYFDRKLENDNKYHDENYTLVLVVIFMTLFFSIVSRIRKFVDIRHINKKFTRLFANG